MPKIIVFCADGTWNGLTIKDAKMEALTNVVKLFDSLSGVVTGESLQLKDEREKFALAADGTTIQVAKYINGVGDTKNPIRKLFEGVTGEGVVDRIIRGYTFVSRHFEPGDKIVLIGFSRGAYTVRALGGLIAKSGLMSYAKLQLDPNDKEAAYKYAINAWAYYRQDRALGTQGLLATFKNIFSLCGDYALGEEHMVPANIHAIGVWDTVGAMGIPQYENNRRVDLFRFADNDLSPKVSLGFHALALDERRVSFEATPWNARAGIEQAWFAGVHADVGGGYAQTGLSDITLDWMMGKIASAGVAFLAAPPSRTTTPALGELHDSYTGVYKERKPIKRLVLPTDGVHESVKTRMATGYEPNATLPIPIRWVS